VSKPTLWASNSDLPAIASWLRGVKRVVVLTHVKPDGDAVGSTVAATRAINLAAGRQVAMPWYWGPLPDWMPEVIGDTAYRVVDEQNRAEHDDGEDPDGVLILDTGSWTQLHEVREWLLKRTHIAAMIDHHRQGDPDVADKRVIEGDAAAVCEPVAELCSLLLKAPGVSALPLEVAEPLYLGLATDTGWFKHSNVSPPVLRTAAALLEAGVNHSRLYALVEQRDRVSRLRLMARALSSLELHDRDRIAVLTLTLQDFHDCHAASTDSAGFSELALSADKVQVCVLITEAFVHEGDGNITKVSFRSKEGPDSVDVNAVAKKLGGGGHIRAAGAKVSAGVAETRKRVLGALGVGA
jgi:phosphoesterase RecJ-like protein